MDLGPVALSFGEGNIRGDGEWQLSCCRARTSHPTLRELQMGERCPHPSHPEGLVPPHPLVVGRAVVELGDGHGAAVPVPEAEPLRNLFKALPVVVGDVDLEEHIGLRWAEATRCQSRGEARRNPQPLRAGAGQHHHGVQHSACCWGVCCARIDPKIVWGHHHTMLISPRANLGASPASLPGAGGCEPSPGAMGRAGRGTYVTVFGTQQRQAVSSQGHDHVALLSCPVNDHLVVGVVEADLQRGGEGHRRQPGLRGRLPAPAHPRKRTGFGETPPNRGLGKLIRTVR